MTRQRWRITFTVELEEPAALLMKRGLSDGYKAAWLRNRLEHALETFLFWLGGGPWRVKVLAGSMRKVDAKEGSV